MADYNLKAEITADASGYEAGIKKAEKASKKLSTSVSKVIQGLGKNGLVGALGAVGLASTGLSATLGTVVKIAKQVSKTIGECTEAYKAQNIAEKQLDTAIRNNPFVTGESSKALKDFASEMQRITNYGDEELIPMMANLVSLGRTEDETMKIMSVALDMSANGAMSLDTAINQLNATLNGNIGRLGQQNAELKDLTEEELKSGKAVEILGQKYKGMAETSADTSKQLNNAIGDFKETIGQTFETALSPMRKYFAEVISKTNDAIKKAREHKNAIKEVFGDDKDGLNLSAGTDSLQDSLVTLQKEYERIYKDQQNYLKIYGKYIDVTKDETALGYERDVSALKEKIRLITEEINQRKETEKQAQKQAEASAKQKKDEEERLVKEKELADLAKQQAEQKEKEQTLLKNWQDKLLSTRLENLEKTRDAELENEELTYEQKLEVYDFYGKQILAMKLKQIEAEREEALNGENVTEETRLAINLFYENKITQAKKEEEEKRLKVKKETNEEEVKEEKEKLNVMVKMVEQTTKKIADTFKNVSQKIVSTIKNVLSGIGNIFTKLFAFNPDEALDNLLKFEDAVLTFFVETLPKLPAFFESAVQSISVLIQTILEIIDFEQISNIIASIIKSIGTLITTIAKNINQNADKLTEGFTQLVQTVITGIADWINSGGWKELLNAILTIQKMIENVVVENLPALVDTIIAMLPDLIDTLIASIVSASQTLAKLIKPILKLIVKLIEAIIEIAFSDEVLDASMEVIEAFVEAIIDILIKDLPKMLPRLIAKVIKFILSSIPKATVAIVKGTVKAFSTTNWGQVIWDCFQGFIDAFKELFGIHSPSTVFEGFGKNMIEGLWNGIKETGEWLINNIKTFFSGMADNIGGTIGNIFNGVSNVFSNIWDNLVNGAIWAVDGIKNAFNGITGTISNIWNNMTSGASQAVEGIKNVFNGIAGSVNSAFGNIGNSIKWAINGVIDTVNVAINSVNSVVGWTGIRLATIQKLANGTDNARKGLTLVGEAGPELVYFNGGEQVLNNRNTNKALAEMGSGKSITNNITFNNTKDTTAFAMMSQLRQYNRQLAINGIL